MSLGWENHEPAPIEFLHGELMNAFHEWRKTVTENTTVEINGTILSQIIAKAKIKTYEKYHKLNLKEPVLKKDLEK